MRKAIGWVCWLVLSCLGLQAAEVPDKESFHLFLLVGQSNMAGRGKLDEKALKADPRVLMFSKAEEWEPATDPMHFDKPNIVGVGLGRAFAEGVVESDPSIVVGLIPCAVGGSPISAWQPGAFYKPTKSHPWDDALRRARNAIKDGQLKGILWHQGESDSKEGLSDQYERNLHNLIARFREALNAPDVPFVVGQMGRFEERPWDRFKQQVDQVHQTLPKNVEGTAFASAEGLRHKGDEIHFDTASFRILGRRYFQAWQTIVRKKK